jgi:hypothetical protein
MLGERWQGAGHPDALPPERKATLSNATPPRATAPERRCTNRRAPSGRLRCLPRALERTGRCRSVAELARWLPVDPSPCDVVDRRFRRPVIRPRDATASAIRARVSPLSLRSPIHVSRRPELGPLRRTSGTRGLVGGFHCVACGADTVPFILFSRTMRVCLPQRPAAYRIRANSSNRFNRRPARELQLGCIPLRRVPTM